MHIQNFTMAITIGQIISIDSALGIAYIAWVGTRAAHPGTAVVKAQA